MNQEKGKFEFKFTNKGFVVISYIGDESVVEIPKKHEGKDVVGVMNATFASEKISPRKIVLQSNIREITGGAFFGCNSIINVEVEKSNPWFCSENGVLFTKDKNKLVYHPAARKSVDETLFNRKHVIGVGAFAGSCMTEVILGDEIIDVEQYAFYGCKELAVCKFPRHITCVHPYTFAYCEKLEQVIGGGLAVFSECAFAECCKFKENKFKRLGKIEENCFKNCAFETFEVSSNMYKIECDGWSYHNAFTDCKNLSGIFVEKRNMFYSDEDGVLFNRDKTELLLYPNGKRDESYVIPDGVETISYGAFKNNKHIKYVTIPESVKLICDEVFQGCTQLKEVEMSKEIETIEMKVFDGCEGLERLVLPETVKYVGWYTFRGCSNLHLYCRLLSLSTAAEARLGDVLKCTFNYDGD